MASLATECAPAAVVMDAARFIARDADDGVSARPICTSWWAGLLLQCSNGILRCMFPVVYEC
jgi:hypothetical protein